VAINNICRQIGYDIKHGATTEQVLMLLQKITNDSSFSTLQGDNESMQRLYELDKHFVHQSKKTSSYSISDNRLFSKYLKSSSFQ
jgi:hypothetical protein